MLSHLRQIPTEGRSNSNKWWFSQIDLRELIVIIAQFPLLVIMEILLLANIVTNPKLVIVELLLLANIVKNPLLAIVGIILPLVVKVP